MISVIIATRNRAEAMASYILPSLARQSYRDFEVIVVDASDDEKTRKISEEMRRGCPFPLSWEGAIVKGLPAQRNQGLKSARGDIVAFFDDDSEVSADGLTVIEEAFDAGSVGGVGLYIDNLENSNRLHLLFNFLFLLPGTPGKGRTVLSSGLNTTDRRDSHGEVEWLSGCSMAFRRSALGDGAAFDERLQRFGGYALGEDFELSHSLALRGWKLVIPEQGSIVHHSVPGGRLNNWNKGAAEAYNFRVIRKHFTQLGERLPRLPFRWSEIGMLLKNGLARPGYLAGYRAGIEAFRHETEEGEI